MITIRNVSYRIGTHPILDNVSLDIPEGGITALIGPNGAGKSTLFSFMARLRPLESGSIAYRGKNLADPHRRTRPHALHPHPRKQHHEPHHRARPADVRPLPLPSRQTDCRMPPYR
ncbi:hypothetical protein TUM15798_15620 [Neisseria gonorrhoeae]|nr:hypothetical protein TUM15798_15620 [Neisseria gonorrhoeae]